MGEHHDDEPREGVLDTDDLVGTMGDPAEVDPEPEEITDRSDESFVEPADVDPVEEDA